jgi:hypothetical protein
VQAELSFIVVLASLFMAGVARAQTDYSTAGPEAFTTSDFTNGTAGSLGGKLVVPNRASRYPLLVNTHGFSGNAAQQIGWGEHFASYGFVAVVPSMPGGLPPDHKGNGDVIRALALLFSDPTYVSPAQGKVDAGRIGLSGHSAGGLQTTFAAALLKPRATVLFDPVDYQMTGRPVYATLCSPVMAIFAEPGACNIQAEWSTFKTTSVGPQIFLDVIGSNHCDPINPAMVGCDLLCGGVSSAQNQANYARYATAYFLAMLKDDAAAAATLTTSALSANPALRDTIVRDAPNCAVGPADAGTDAAVDGALPDVMTPPDAAVSSDGATRDGSAAPDGSSDVTALPDAQSDGGADAPVTVADASRDGVVDAPVPMTEPPLDAASHSDASISMPSRDGAPPGTTPTGSDAGTSAGCDCSASRRRTLSPVWLPASLFGFVAFCRRRARRNSGLIPSSQRSPPVSRR